jgi:protein tyrosine/serine phosphatase
MARTRDLVTLAVVVVLAGTGGLVAAQWRDILPKRFGVVAEGKVYRSGELTPKAMRTIVERHKIKTIIDLGADEPGTPDDVRAQRTADALGVTRFVFRDMSSGAGTNGLANNVLIGDATGNPNAYVQALRIMTDPARQPVLVHCGAGTQRTGCVVILYRHIIEGVPTEAAFPEAARFDHDPVKNPKLTGMLERWGKPIEDALKNGGQVIDPEAPALPEPVPVEPILHDKTDKSRD